MKYVRIVRRKHMLILGINGLILHNCKEIFNFESAFCRLAMTAQVSWTDRSWQSLFLNCWRKMTRRATLYICYKLRWAILENVASPIVKRILLRKAELHITWNSSRCHSFDIVLRVSLLVFSFGVNVNWQQLVFCSPENKNVLYLTLFQWL